MAKLFKIPSLLDCYKKILCSRPTINYQQTFGIKQDTSASDKLSSVNVPEKPKKPMTPFFRFLFDHRQDILKENPGLKLVEVTKLCNEKWKNIDVEHKNKYQVKYKEDLAEYTSKIASYESNLTEEQKKAIKDAKLKKQQTKEKKKLRQVLQEMNKPKKPAGAFMYFLMDEAKAANSSPIKMASLVKDKWHAMPDNEKLKYHHLFIHAKKAYEEEILKWENKMISEGRADLVRLKTLKDANLPVDNKDNSKKRKPSSSLKSQKTKDKGLDQATLPLMPHEKKGLESE